MFNGYKSRDAEDPEERRDFARRRRQELCRGLKLVMDQVEKKKVKICLEMLNTRAIDHPMKGHPGYQGDHIEYCLDIARRSARRT